MELKNIPKTKNGITNTRLHAVQFNNDKKPIELVHANAAESIPALGNIKPGDVIRFDLKDINIVANNVIKKNVVLTRCASKLILYNISTSIECAPANVKSRCFNMCFYSYFL